MSESRYSDAFRRLLSTHALASRLKQARMGEVLGDRPWQLDLRGGALSFGRDQEPFSIQLLGSYSSHAGTWMWAWGQSSSSIKADLLQAGMALQSQFGEAEGISEFQESSIETDHDDLFPHKLGMIALGLRPASAYYVCDYGEGSALVLMEPYDDRLTASLPPAQRVASVFMELLESIPFDHLLAWTSLLDRWQIRHEESRDNDERRVEATWPASGSDPGGLVYAVFDRKNRLINLQLPVKG